MIKIDYQVLIYKVLFTCVISVRTLILLIYKKYIKLNGLINLTTRFL
jgi:hypothetical protein